MSDDTTTFLNAEIQIKSVSYNVSLSVTSESKNERLCLELRNSNTVDTWTGTFESTCKL